MERNENGFSGYNFTAGERIGAQGSNGCGRSTRENGGCSNGCTGSNGVNEGSMLASPQLAMVYSPSQQFRMLYSPEKALMRGTLFEELDKPLEDCVYG